MWLIGVTPGIFPLVEYWVIIFMGRREDFDGDIILIPSQMVGSSGIFPSIPLYTRIPSRHWKNYWKFVEGLLATNPSGSS